MLIYESILAGIIAAIIIILIQKFYFIFRCWYNLKRKFNKKSFIAHEKKIADRNVKGERHSYSCNVKGNVLFFTGNNCDSKRKYSGRFIINSKDFMTGEGYHIDDEDTSEGFSFAKIIIKDDSTFYVEIDFSYKSSDKWSQKRKAFVWEKANSKGNIK